MLKEEDNEALHDGKIRMKKDLYGYGFTEESPTGIASWTWEAAIWGRQ